MPSMQYLHTEDCKKPQGPYMHDKGSREWT